jgi:Spy/CpxP family protein refolding chaperone
MRRWRRTTALWLAALALGLGRVAAAGGPDAPPPEGPGGPWHHGPPPLGDVLERHADELGLDADTRARIRQIAETSRDEEQPLATQLRALHEGMHQLLEGDAPKLDDVMHQADEIGALETQLRKHQLRTLLQIRALLTPDQRQKLVQIFEAKRARWHGHEGPPGGAPPEAPPPASNAR